MHTREFWFNISKIIQKMIAPTMFDLYLTRLQFAFFLYELKQKNKLGMLRKFYVTEQKENFKCLTYKA